MLKKDAITMMSREVSGSLHSDTHGNLLLSISNLFPLPPISNSIFLYFTKNFITILILKLGVIFASVDVGNCAIQQKWPK